MIKNKTEFNDAVAKYRKLTATKKQVDAELDDVKSEIIQYVEKKGKKGGTDGNSRIVYGEGYKVSVTTINRPSFDSEKLQKLLGTKLPDYQKISPYPRVNVS